jgi:hypothetical protein
MADKVRRLLSELRARSLDCFKEGESITVVVQADRGAAFQVNRFEGRWYLGACARRGVTYVLPEGGDVVAACVEWAAGWAQAPPAEAGWGAAASPEVVARLGLRRLSPAEVSAWFDAMIRSAMRRASRAGG